MNEYDIGAPGVEPEQRLHKSRMHKPVHHTPYIINKNDQQYICLSSQFDYFKLSLSIFMLMKRTFATEIVIV